MINESSYWKRELVNIGVDLRRRRKQKRWPDPSLARVEIDIMLAFYMIRKLFEARKVSDLVAKRRFRLQLHRATGKRVTYQNMHHIEDLYDFSHRQSETRTVAFICDQIIHSYIFVLCFADTVGWGGVIFASDRHKNRGVFYLRSRQVIAILESVARNDPARIRWKIDLRTGEEQLRVGADLPLPAA